MADKSPLAGLLGRAGVKPPAASNGPGIDTTPTLPEPPPGLIEAAALGIPGILLNLQPGHDGAIELRASDLAKRLQDAGHTLAAAHWAIHEAVRVGWLQPGLIEVPLPSFGRQVGRREMYGSPDTRRMEWSGGGYEMIAIPEGRPAPFKSFKVAATEYLWVCWSSLDPETRKAKSTASADATENQCETAVTGHPAESTPRKPKRSTERGEGQKKLIAALTKHHQYAQGGSLNLEPIGNNELARLAGVAQRTASAFFRKKFQGHSKYKALCADAGRLAAALKLLNGEFAPHLLYGSTPSQRPEREQDADDE
jgi:hypothetical protein